MQNKYSPSGPSRRLLGLHQCHPSVVGDHDHIGGYRRLLEWRPIPGIPPASALSESANTRQLHSLTERVVHASAIVFTDDRDSFDPLVADALGVGVRYWAQRWVGPQMFAANMSRGSLVLNCSVSPAGRKEVSANGNQQSDLVDNQLSEQRHPCIGSMPRALRGRNFGRSPCKGGTGGA